LNEPVAASRFTTPVSIILVAEENFERVPQTIRMLMELTYPEFEVIVVAEPLPGDVQDQLSKEWGLAAKEFFYRRSIDTAAVRRIYRATVDSRLTIVDKVGAGHADALNCGLDMARFRYVCTIPDGVQVEPDGLLRTMSPALWDPASVLAVTSHVERRSSASAAVNGNGHNGNGTEGSPRHERVSLWARFAAPYQHLSSLRSLMDSRLIWGRLKGGLGPHEPVIIWRRDALIQLGGFSNTAADAFLDMMVRLQSAGPERMPGRLVRSPEVFAYAEPATLREVIRRATRRQRAAVQTLPETSHTWSGIAPRFRRQESIVLAYFLTTELVTPLLQAWIVTAGVAGALAGWLRWSEVVLAIVLLSFGNAVVSAAALFLRAAARGAPEEVALKRLLLTAPLEFILYRPVVAYARLAAVGSSVVHLFRRRA
jgi:hypothetical protein